MTRYFRVEGTDRNGRKMAPQLRIVMDLPDVHEDELDQTLRDLWAKHYPGETYQKIEPLTDEVQPPAGAFPGNVRLPQPAATDKPVPAQ